MTHPIDQLPCGFFSIDSEQHIVSANATISEWLGVEKNELIGSRIDTILTDSTKIFFQMYAWTMLKLQGSIHEVYINLKTKAAKELPVLVNARESHEDGRAKIDFAVFTMTTRYKLEAQLQLARKEAEQAIADKDQAIHELEQTKAELQALNTKLYELATTDTLTRINNRFSFMKELERKMTIHRGNQLPLTLLLIDIDYFKKINDCYGHLIGDQVLQTTAAVLSAGIRECDMVGRLGGEEFAILLPQVDQEEAAKIAKRLLKRVESTCFKQASELRVTISIGIATFHANEHAEALFSRADQALYAAKANGRNQAKIAD